jgi:hypothetical protein
VPYAKAPAKEGCDEQDLDTFPENLVKRRMKPVDSVQYGSINGSASSITRESPGNSVKLPQFEKDEKITYMIASHAPVAHIKLGGKWSLRIDEGMLTADKTLDIDKLRDENVGDDDEDESDDDEESGHHEETGHEIDALKERWNTLMEGVRDGVIIKFLFTRAQG